MFIVNRKLHAAFVIGSLIYEASLDTPAVPDA